MFKWLRYQFQKLTRPTTVRCGDATLFIGPLAGTSYARSIYRGTHETEERDVIARHLSSNDKVVEFGSGLGLITVLCCKTVGPENVVTYEANSKMEPLLRKTFELNGVTPELRMKMVSIQDGDQSFFVSNRFVVSSQIQHDDSASEVQVPTDSFSTILQELKPTFLIMDIEGTEVDLADETIDLSCLNKICVEVHPQIVGDEPTSALVQSLLNRGFQLNLSSSKGDVLFFNRPAKSQSSQHHPAA